MDVNDELLPPLTDPTPEFVFVAEQDIGSVRSHAMREHWKKRHHARELRRRRSMPSQRSRSLRPLTGREDSETAPGAAAGGSPSSSSVSPTKPSSPSESPQQQQPQQQPLSVTTHGEASRSGVAEGMGTALARCLSLLDGYGIPAHLLGGIHRALACSQLDPFNSLPVRLSSEHDKLLHHWLSRYSKTISEDLSETFTFNTTREVWLPLDLSNAACFNVAMAHSAAHLARMQGIRDSPEALKFKMEAVKVVTVWMSDPERALSDDAFAAVLRLLTYERYWGTETEWKIHRYGLQKMVAARGGIAALQGNRRLELAIFLVLLMAKPTWFDIANQIMELSMPQGNEPRHPFLGQAENVQNVRSLWFISLAQDIRTLVTAPSSRLLQYPSIRRALALLHADFRQPPPEAQGNSSDYTFTEHEFSRITCIFFIYMLLQSVHHQPSPSPGSWDAASGSAADNPDSLAIVDRMLQCSVDAWQGPNLERLCSTLFRAAHDLPGEANKMEYARKLTTVLGQTGAEARRGVCRYLLHTPFPARLNPHVIQHGDYWTPDPLLSAIHGL